jgi:hypothetical protein
MTLLEIDFVSSIGIPLEGDPGDFWIVDCIVVYY